METEHRHIALVQLADDEVRVNVEGLSHDQHRPLIGHDRQANPDSPQWEDPHMNVPIATLTGLGGGFTLTAPTTLGSGGWHGRPTRRTLLGTVPSRSYRSCRRNHQHRLPRRRRGL